MLQALEQWIKESPNAIDIKAVFDAIENLPEYEQPALWAALNQVAVARRRLA